MGRLMHRVLASASQQTVSSSSVKKPGLYWQPAACSQQAGHREEAEQRLMSRLFEVSRITSRGRNTVYSNCVMEFWCRVLRGNLTSATQM
jgi:hypothetical protein